VIFERKLKVLIAWLWRING